MINYIDYYFEASEKTLKEKKPVSIAKPTNTTLPLELKSEWENHWNEIKNIFLGLTGGGVWKEVEEDFREIAEYIDGKNTIQSNKWGPASQNTLRPWREFFDLLFFKMHKNKTIETINGIRPGEKWKTPNLDLLKKEIVQYIIIKAFSFNNKGNLQYNKNIKNVLEKLIDLNKISEANFVEFKNDFEINNKIDIDTFPHLKVFLSHPYRAKYYDNQISKFMTGKPGKVKGQTLAEYTGYFNPSNNVTDTSIEDNPQIDISNSSINNKDPEYLKESKKLLKAFIKNVYQTTDEDIKEIIEIQAGLGNFLPPLTTITDNSSHEKLARNILYQLSFFKKDLDITEILEDFLFFYNKNVSNKVSLDSDKLTPQAQKEKERLKKELNDAIKKLKEINKTIELIKKNVSITKKISPLQQSVLNDYETDASNLITKIGLMGDQLEAYQWSDDSIQNYMNNIKQSLPEIRKGIASGIAKGNEERKIEKIEKKEIDETKKYKEEIQKAKEDLENLVKKGFREIWNTYQPHLLGNTIESDFDSYWKKIKVEYQKNLEDKFKIPVDLEKLPEPLLNELKEYKKSARESFKDTIDELKQVKTNYDKLLKTQKSHIRKVINDPALGDQYFQKIYDYILQNRRKLSTSDIDAIIAGGLPAEEIQNKIKKDTTDKVEKALLSTNIIKLKPAEWAVKFKELIIKDFKNNISKLSVFLSNNIEITEKDFLKGLELEKKVLEAEELEKLRTEGLTKEDTTLIKSILKRHILQ